MPTLDLDHREQTLLSDFVLREGPAGAKLPRHTSSLLARVMREVDVRQLDLVDPDAVRDLLRSTFDIIKAKHLFENNLLTREQYEGRLGEARVRLVAGAL